MTDKTDGVGAFPDGSGFRPSDGAASVSAVPASIPNAGDFAVIDNWRFEVVEVVKVTQHFLFYRDARGRETKQSISVLLCHSSARTVAELAASRLTSAKAERDRREASARAWFAKERRRIAAIAMDAGTDETERLGPKGDSAGLKGIAPQSDGEVG